MIAPRFDDLRQHSDILQLRTGTSLTVRFVEPRTPTPCRVTAGPPYSRGTRDMRAPSMPLFISQNQNVRGIRWRGIAGTVVVELLVLLALGAAVVRYVEWSSDAALAEFMSATEPSASVANHSGEFSTPVQALKVRADCDRKG
jgi:hypothetical protein